jgi:Icc-related predicted phosphoesterase
MHILIIADTKPKRQISEWVATEKIDLIVTLGDLEQSELSELEAITHIPKIGVYGNHCFPGYMENLGIYDMHMHTWSFGGLTFGGFEGCVRYKKNPYAKMYTQEEATALMQHFPRVDVFIAHSPPLGINDDTDPAHVGFSAFRTYLETKQPRYFLHGHTYPKEAELIRNFINTEIVYTHGDRTFDIV